MFQLCTSFFKDSLSSLGSPDISFIRALDMSLLGALDVSLLSPGDPDASLLSFKALDGFRLPLEGLNASLSLADLDNSPFPLLGLDVL